VIQRTHDAGEAFFNVEGIHDETRARGSTGPSNRTSTR
jgi:hypothetical protein